MNYDKIIIQLSLFFKHMLQFFLFMGYLTRTSNYPERIALSDSTHMMSMADLVKIGVQTPRIGSGCSLEKEFPELICINP